MGTPKFGAVRMGFSAGCELTDLWLGWLELQECLVKMVLSLGVGLKPTYNWGGTTSPPPRTQNHDPLVWVTPLLMRQMIQNNGA